MIPARKSALADAVLGRLITRGLRKAFHAFYADGLEHLAALDPARPVVGCCNHTNWWDGFVLREFTAHHTDRAFYIAMEEKNLRRYFYLAWLGAFGVDLESPGGAIGGLRHGAQLLRAAPDRLAWVFVQGRLLAPSVPIEAKPGASFFARQSKALLLPAILRYVWLAESRPSIFLRLGAPLESDTGPERIAAVLNAQAAALDADLVARGPAGWVALLPPRRSINRRWDYFVHRLRGRSAESFE
ncbi:MAG: lysophospholipid acyltransferase family protein [Verrucomicrobia bacterium]|nr:lysophospholipid acyltransferase family protein [Verrucomicrobiota bacterium]